MDIKEIGRLKLAGGEARVFELQVHFKSYLDVIEALATLGCRPADEEEVSEVGNFEPTEGPWVPPFERQLFERNVYALGSVDNGVAPYCYLMEAGPDTSYGRVDGSWQPLERVMGFPVDDPETVASDDLGIAGMNVSNRLFIDHPGFLGGSWGCAPVRPSRVVNMTNDPNSLRQNRADRRKRR